MENGCRQLKSVSVGRPAKTVKDGLRITQHVFPLHFRNHAESNRLRELAIPLNRPDLSNEALSVFPTHSRAFVVLGEWLWLCWPDSIRTFSLANQPLREKPADIVITRPEKEDSFDVHL